MKPLPTTPLTPEDEDIWHFVGLHPYWALRFELEVLSISADRRDAELILGYERAKANLISRNGVQCYIDTRAMVNAVMSERVEPVE